MLKLPERIIRPKNKMNEEESLGSAILDMYEKEQTAARCGECGETKKLYKRGMGRESLCLRCLVIVMKREYTNFQADYAIDIKKNHKPLYTLKRMSNIVMLYGVDRSKRLCKGKIGKIEERRRAQNVR